jgi:hypothetical protein
VRSVQQVGDACKLARLGWHDKGKDKGKQTAGLRHGKIKDVKAVRMLTHHSLSLQI